MKKLLFIVIATILCAMTIGTPTLADSEQAYFVDAPTVTVNQSNKSATVAFTVQRTEGNGIKQFDLSVDWTEPQTDPNVITANSSSQSGIRSCYYGTSLSCDEQMQKPMNISFTQDNMIEGVVYTISGLKLNSSISVPGVIKFSLEDGLISSTFAVIPSESEEPEAQIVVVEEPKVTVADDRSKATIDFSFQDATNGIKEYEYVINFSADGPTSSLSASYGQGVRQCTIGGTQSCLEQLSVPFDITASIDNPRSDGTYTLKNVKVTDVNNIKRDVPGELKFRLDEGIVSNTFMLASNPSADNTTNNASGKATAKNPDTIDPAPVAMAGAISFIGVCSFGLRRLTRR